MDEQRILTKIAELEKYLRECQEILPETEINYIESTLHRRAIERILQIAIESVIDISAILVNQLKLGPPKDEDNILDLLKDSLSSVEKIKEMKRFRNILVHKYGVINDKKVYQNASENLDDFYQFIEEVKKLLEKEDISIHHPTQNPDPETNQKAKPKAKVKKT